MLLIRADQYKVKIESDQVYYEVPFGTKVVINAKAEGPEENIVIGWNYSAANLDANQPVSMSSLPKKGEKTWEYASDTPIKMLVHGDGPFKEENGVKLTTQENQKFHITWKNI